jgi:hypothetical protein
MNPVRGSHVSLLVGARAAAHNAMPPLLAVKSFSAECILPEPDGQVELPNALCMISILTLRSNLVERVFAESFSEPSMGAKTGARHPG